MRPKTTMAQKLQTVSPHPHLPKAESTYMFRKSLLVLAVMGSALPAINLAEEASPLFGIKRTF